MSTEAPMATLWRKSPWQLTQWEENQVANWRELKRLRSSLDGAKFIWSGTILVAVPFLMLAFGVLALGTVDSTMRLIGCEGFLSPDDQSAAQTIPLFVIPVAFQIFYFESVLIAALKYIGQLKDRIEEMEKSSHE